MSVITFIYLSIGFLVWICFACSLKQEEISKYALYLIFLLPVLCILWPMFWILVFIMYLKKSGHI